MDNEMIDRRCARRPLFFQVDSINEKKRAIERNKMLIENPIAGSFRVSNGKFLCDVYLSEDGIRVECRNRKGVVETISTNRITG